MDINKFYKNNIVEKDFDEVLYQKKYPETKDFYQPYCKNNNIDDKHRLYFHYINYGNRRDKFNKNTNQKIAIKIPTYKRPNKLITSIESFINNSSKPENLEIIVSADKSDHLTFNIIENLEKYQCVKVFFGDYDNKIKAYNANLEKVDFDILIFASDDMVVVKKNYDAIINSLMQQYFPDNDGCLWFDTGDGNDVTNTMPIIGRKLFDQVKPVYNYEYLGYFCDDEFTQKCIKLGKIVKIQNLIIKHNVFKYMDMHNDPTYLKSLKYSHFDKAKYKIRKSVQFDNALMLELPKNHNILKKNTKIDGKWYKTEPCNNDPISTFDLYILEKKYEKVFKMNNEDFIFFAKNYFRNFRWTIPKIIHQIWLGEKNSEIDEMMSCFSKKYIQKHPDWRYILWDSEKLRDLKMFNKDIFDIEESYDCKSDIARLEIIHQFGGIYIDSDIIWLENNPIDKLLDLDDRGILIFNEKSGNEIGKGYLTKNKTRSSNGIIGSTIMNPIISFLIGKLKKSYVDNRKNGVVASTGPDFLQKYVDILNLNVVDYEYAYPVWFCLDKSRNPEYDKFIKYRSSKISEISKEYPKSVFFHKGWKKD